MDGMLFLACAVILSPDNVSVHQVIAFLPLLISSEATCSKFGYMFLRKQGNIGVSRNRNNFGARDSSQIIQREYTTTKNPEAFLTRSKKQKNSTTLVGGKPKT